MIRLNAHNDCGGLFGHTVITVATLLILAGVVYAVVRSHSHSQAENRRKAMQICEDGLMVALQCISEQPSWRNGFTRTEHEDGWYEVTVKQVDGVQPSQLHLEALGWSAGVTRKLTYSLSLSIENGDSVWVYKGTREQ